MGTSGYTGVSCSYIRYTFLVTGVQYYQLHPSSTVTFFTLFPSLSHSLFLSLSLSLSFSLYSSFSLSLSLSLSLLISKVLTMQGYGKEADLWSVGVIMFLLLCGKLPFDGDDHNEIIRSTIQVRIQSELFLDY